MKPQGNELKSEYRGSEDKASLQYLSYLSQTLASQSKMRAIGSEMKYSTNEAMLREAELARNEQANGLVSDLEGLKARL